MMTSERWSRIEEIYHAARAYDGAARSVFLDDACGGDADLRREVQSLLEYDSAADGFLERTAIETAAAEIAGDAVTARPGQRIGGYEIASLLGVGGMGQVYRARDLRLGRDAALKVLAPELAGDPDYAQRFEDEARSASVLNHPGIVTIYGVGEDGVTPYIAMELVHGRTLRAFLASGAMPLSQVVDLASQLATALAAAHAAGIVHRDLKPENVMVTPEGLVKVLDFGIAKRAHGLGRWPVSRESGGGRSGTASGAILGTAGYMSPEQAAGRPVTFRSDQFAFGAMLYEMLAGQAAFERDSTQATLAAIMAEEPPPLRHANPGIPGAVLQLVDRCLAKDPAKRYADTRDLALELRDIRARIERDMSVGMGRRRVLWLAGAAAAALGSGFAGWIAYTRPSRVHSLAVLPFVNTDHEPEAEYLSDGLTTTLIQRIAPLPSLTVMARSLVFNFKGNSADPRAIGRQLGVDAVVSGSVVRRNARVLVTAELVDVASGRVLWSRSYDRDSSDLLAVEGEIASAIVDAIRLRVTGEERRKLTRRLTDDPQAYQLYLSAVHAYTGGGEDGYLLARRLLQQAIARDPTFALAYAGLATTYAIMAVDGFERPTEAWLQSGRAVRQALRLDPDLSDAHAAAASEAFWFNWDWDGADREWNIVLEAPGTLDPNFLRARALQIWARGRGGESLALAERARRLDPVSTAFKLTEADYLFHAARLDEALRLYEAIIHDQPQNDAAYMGIAEVRRAQGRYDDAIEAWRRSRRSLDEPLGGVLAGARGAAGYALVERTAARLELAALLDMSRRGAYVSPLDVARAYARMGEPARAFALFDAAFADRAPGLTLLKVDRVWDGMREDSRFVAALQRVGL